jgi:formate C-acetyltransferase
VESNVLTREKAKELISAFSIKMSEIIPVFSEYLTGIHGGMFNGQVVTVGGLGRDGKDATNDLSYIFLEVMDELRMRQPNYHARISEDSSCTDFRGFPGGISDPDQHHAGIRKQLAGLV